MIKAFSGLMVGLLSVAGSLGVLAQEAFWEQTTGPGGGVVHDLAATPQGDVYATVGSDQNKVFYRSEDDGATWTALLAPDAFRKLVVSPSGRLFAPLGERLYYSNDRALNWHVSTIAGVEIKTLTFGVAGRVFAGTDQGVYRTDDLDAGWQAAGLDSVEVLDLLYTSAGSLVVVSARYVFRSDDDGATWRHVASFESVWVRLWSVSLVEHPGGDVYIGVAGLRFLVDRPGVFRLSVSDSLVRVGLDNYSINTLVMVDEGLLIAATGGINSGLPAGPASVFRYLIDDDVWIPAGLGSTLVNDLVMTASGAYVAGTRGLSTDYSKYVGRGLVRAPGGNDFSWTFAGQGIPAAETYTLATGAGLVCAAADYSVFCSEDQGDVWTLIYTPSPDNEPEVPPLYRGIAIHPEGDIFLRRWRGNLLRSQDRGATWTELPVDLVYYGGPPMRFIGGQQPYHRHLMVIAASGTVLVGEYKIWRSPDRGETWEEHPSPMPGTWVIGLAAAPTGRLFALTGHYINLEETSVFTSDDDGLSWTLQARLPRFASPLPFPSYMLSLATNAEDQLFVLAGGEGPVRLFHVKEEDEAWVVETIAGVPGLNDLVIDAEDVLYLGSRDDPVLISKDEGRTWQSLADDVLPSSGLSVAVDADGRLYVGTPNNGVFRNRTNTGTATVPGAEIPAGLALEAGYPNPFTRIVTIPFALARSARVAVTVYDLLGRKVATVIEGEQKQAGRHEINWDAAGLPAGVYIYKLIADGTVKAGRVVLVK